MKDNKILCVLDLFKGIYNKFGINYNEMRLILEVKLTMDKRRKSTIFNDTKQKESNNNFMMSLLMYAVLGIFLAMFVALKYNVMLQMTLYYSIFMFMIASIFISDFSYVLLDVRDKNIISTKGIERKVVNAAKITHIIIYITMITLALTGFSIIASISQGIGFTLIFVMSLFLIDLLMVLVTSFIYFLVLKFFDGEKLKDIINIVQIILSVSMVLIYQLMGRITSLFEMNKVTTESKWWYSILPPMWFAAPLQMVKTLQGDLILIICTVLAIIIPIISIIVYFKISDSFEGYMQKLNNNTYISKDKVKLSYKISKLICKDPIERSFFNFTNEIISSERTFKLKTYPSLAMAVFFPFIFIFITLDKFSSISTLREIMANSKGYLNIYFSVLLLTNSIFMITYSEQHKGSWLYKVVPIKDLSIIFKGTIKGAIYKFVVPVYLAISVLFIAVFGYKVILHLFIAAIVLLIIILLEFKMFKKYLPFSRTFDIIDTSENLVNMFTTLGFLILFVGIHFITTFIKAGAYIYILVLLGILVVLWKNVFKVSWNNIY